MDDACGVKDAVVTPTITLAAASHYSFGGGWVLKASVLVTFL